MRRSGVRIGEVGSIRLDDETGKVRVAVLLIANTSFAPSDRPTIIQGLLGGDASIDFAAARTTAK